MDMNDQIKDISILWGADFSGVADLSLADSHRAANGTTLREL